MAPLQSAKAADAKIKAAGGNIETVFYPTGGHGFFNAAAAKTGHEVLSSE